MSLRTTLRGIFSRERGMRFVILLFWAAFWLVTVIDTYIGGPMYLFVGRDRFAQLATFFSAAGFSGSALPTASLVLIAWLQISAFVLSIGALYYFIRRADEKARLWFFWGSFMGLVTFGLFTVGDQLFGERFELLLHTIFWVAIIVSWAAFLWFRTLKTHPKSVLGGEEVIGMWIAGLAIFILTMTAGFMIGTYTQESREEAQGIVTPAEVSPGLWRFEFSFQAGQATWESSLDAFMEDHHHDRITQVFTAPSALEGEQSTDLTIYMMLEEGVR